MNSDIDKVYANITFGDYRVIVLTYKNTREVCRLFLEERQKDSLGNESWRVVHTRTVDPFRTKSDERDSDSIIINCILASILSFNRTFEFPEKKKAKPEEAGF